MLPLRPGQKLPQDPVSEDPPQWIHEVSGRVVAARFAAARGAEALDRLRGRATKNSRYAAFRSPAGNSPIAVLIASSTRSRNTNSSF